MPGVQDIHLHIGRAPAKRNLGSMTAWAAQFPRSLNSTQMQNVLSSEQSGMNEVLADAYVITGNDDYPSLARQFNEKSEHDPPTRRRAILNG
ncbi:protein containing DUF1680 [mine drainage metagenome]|uniref:Protein containing DUF1680 n=1 Tax=mine drainage metagenome TaxID=410659 RepID=T1BX90_9ZZZZ